MIFFDRCPACGSARWTGLRRYETIPTFLFPLDEPEAKRVEALSLEICRCETCGHMARNGWQEAVLKKIYTEHYAAYPNDTSEAHLTVYKRPFDAFFEVTKPRGNTPLLLEIGCSSPRNLIPFREAGYEPMGVDPSPCATADEPGIRIIRNFYEQAVIPRPADAIVSRFCLEHVTDLSSHVGKISRDAGAGCEVYIQVPNAGLGLVGLSPFFFSHEHIHYFSESSLTALFARFGFAPRRMDSSGPSILAVFQRPEMPIPALAPPLIDAAGIRRWMDGVAAQKASLTRLFQRHQDLVFYGCGMAAYWALSEIPSCRTQLRFLVDDNPAYVGHNVPYWGFPIHAPGVDQLGTQTLIFVAVNPAYHDRIRDRLRDSTNKEAFWTFPPGAMAPRRLFAV